MPALRMPKREKFAQLVVSGKTYTEAYLESRPHTIVRRDVAAHHGSVLAKEPDVASRIEELRRPVVSKVQKQFAYTLESAMGEIEKAEQLAQAMLQPNVMLQAVKLKAQLQKLLVSVRETRGETPLDAASTEELMDLLRELREKKQTTGSGTAHAEGAGSESGKRLRLVS